MSEELPYKTAAASASHQQPRETLISPVGSNLGMDKSTLKVHLPDGSFNVVRFGDATDIKVWPFFRQIIDCFFLLLKIGNFMTHTSQIIVLLRYSSEILWINWYFFGGTSQLFWNENHFTDGCHAPGFLKLWFSPNLSFIFILGNFYVYNNVVLPFANEFYLKCKEFKSSNSTTTSFFSLILSVVIYTGLSFYSYY